MSKPLAISAAFSVFAMAALALLGPHTMADPQIQIGQMQIGATSELAAPTLSVDLPTLP